MTSSTNKFIGFFQPQANLPNVSDAPKVPGLGLWLDLVLGSDRKPQLHRRSTSFLKRTFRVQDNTVPFTTIQALAQAQPVTIATEDTELAELLAAEFADLLLSDTIWLASSSLNLLKIFEPFSPRMVHIAIGKTYGEKHANDLHKQGIRYTALPKQLCTKGTLALYKKFSVEVFASELVQLREMAQAVEAGAKGLISINGDNLAATVQEHQTSVE